MQLYIFIMLFEKMHVHINTKGNSTHEAGTRDTDRSLWYQ